MKFSSIYTYLLFVLLLVNTVIAGPPQRLIIQFDSPLSAEQKQTLTKQIELILTTDYSLLPHSTDLRWIIVIDPVVDQLSLEQSIKAISRLEHVKYVEPDNLLEVFH